jgi:hypothetical protein
MSGSLPPPPIITAAGPQPQLPADLRTQLVALVSSTNPDFTDNLPASLIEDMVSTAVATISLCDAARVDVLNDVSPTTANAYVLGQLGPMLGVPIGLAQNGSVSVVFTGPAGYVIPIGFTMSDGANQYITSDGGVVPASGVSEPIFFVSTTPGSFPIPAGTVNQIVTSVPSTITLTATNPVAGTAATATQTEPEYRSQVIQAYAGPAQGMPDYLRTLLAAVPGTVANLVSIRQVIGVGWEIIVGGGDPYAVAAAILRAMFDVSRLVGSTLSVTGITNANPGVVTTNLNHGFTTGQVIEMTGVVGMSGVNGTPLTITVLTPVTFSIGTNTTSSGAYVSGGVVTPNLRNQSVNLIDGPDTYTVPFVLPPQQSLTLVVTWNTSLPNFVLQSTVNALGAQALINYVNALNVGQAINLFEMNAVFQQAVIAVIPTQFLTRLVYAVSINGIGVSPATGTGTIAGDPESSFLAGPASVLVSQG